MKINTSINFSHIIFVIFSFSIALCNVAMAESEEDLAKKLANPISSLISVPIQANYDENFGVKAQGEIWRINVQPVIPFSLNNEWNLISRTIFPIIVQNDFPANGDDKFGLGDTVQGVYFSPKAPTDGGLIWGAGPVLYLPTATDKVLGAEKWGIGPTGVLLKQQGSWTFGFLANHIESFAGEDSRDDISATFLQPFASYITHTKTTIGLNTESTYDWETDKWSVPINFTVNQLLKVGDQILQVGGGLRYWAESPSSGADDLGLRLQLTFLFPK
jgi:hypothetical protein